ncbi:MAG: hypothetical protein RL472_1466 [Pseudomonadota bacterium]|jgi:hypothetical protein
MAIQMNSQLSDKPQAAQSMTDLFSLHDLAFVRCAYQTVLGRDADPSGLDHFVDRLRNGTAKIDILVDLRQSDEGRRAALDLGWLDSAIARRHRITNRWFGWLLRLGGKTERNDPYSKRIRAIDNNISRLCDNLEGRLARLEQSVDGIDFTINRQHDALVEFLRGPGQIQAMPSEPAPPPYNRAKSKPLDLSPRASSVLRGLRAAQAAASTSLES